MSNMLWLPLQPERYPARIKGVPPARSFNYQNTFYKACLFIAVLFVAVSCSVSKRITREANSNLLKDAALSGGHAGISIYEPATNKFWYEYNANKYFVPASNTKLFSLYAGMKYLGDSIAGLRYVVENDSSVRIQATGDPTFLHPSFIRQPVFDFLNHFKKITITNDPFKDNYLGAGWAWDDYMEPYMAQRSSFPLYGNLVTIKTKGNTLAVNPGDQTISIAAGTNIEDGFNVEKNGTIIH